MTEHGTIDRGDGVRLAWRYRPARRVGATPTLVFLPGYGSDMEGTKATETDGFAATHGLGCLRLDYSGHGTSDGRMEDGTIRRWRDDALAVIDARTTGRLVLVGSSMGGWIMLLVALARRPRIAGMLGIAAAPDFTERLIQAGLDAAARAALNRLGYLEAPSRYGAPYRFTRALIEEGRRHLLMEAPIPLPCPARLLHGQRDEDVPWRTALDLAERLAAEDVRVTLIKDGDHRLSRPADLALLHAALAGLTLGGEDGGQALTVTGVAPGAA